MVLLVAFLTVDLALPMLAQDVAIKPLVLTVHLVFNMVVQAPTVDLVLPMVDTALQSTSHDAHPMVSQALHTVAPAFPMVAQALPIKNPDVVAKARKEQKSSRLTVILK